MPRTAICRCLVLLLALAATLSAGEASSPDNLASLKQSLSQAAAQDPDPQRMLTVARDRLATAVDQLEWYLAEGGAKTLEGWRTWLDLPALKAELARPESNAQALRSLEDRYYKNQVGLEQRAFLAVRRELRRYLVAQEYASSTDLFRQRLEELAACVDRLESQPSQHDAHRAGAIVAWLEQLDDDLSPLARSVRARYCRENGVAFVSARTMNLLAEQNVSERRNITDFILGSYTQGIAITQGRVSFAVVPNGEQGTLEVRFNGNTVCPDNVARRGRVSVYTSAQTALNAAKRVYVNDQGLTLAPAVAHGVSKVQINDVDARLRLIERIAWRKANELRPQAESAASQRAQTEVVAKLDEQASVILGDANNLFCNQIRAPLIRFDALPARLRFWTDHEHVRLSLSQHDRNQLAAAEPAPPLPSTYDLAGTVHESMVNNLCESLLGGVTVEDQTWLDVMHLMLGTPPRQLWVHDRAERWSVTFAREQPLLVQFVDGRIGILFRFTKIIRGARTHEHPVEIQAQFLPQKTTEGPALLREGEMSIRFTEPLAIQEEQPLRSFLARKFGAVLPADLHFDGLVPPEGGSLGKLRRLHLQEFNAARGWVSLGYQLK